MRTWSRTIYGEPASKANSRRKIVDKRSGNERFIKSEKALAYADDFAKQCGVLMPLLEGPLYVHIQIWYASMRPDLDESLILDLLQGRVYKNDRQIVLKVVERMPCDKRNPRSHIVVTEAPSEMKRRAQAARSRVR